MTTTQHPDTIAPATTTTAAQHTAPAAQPTAPAFAPTAQPTPPAGVPAHTPPSIHVRALLTWIAIFPLVTIGLTLIAPVSEAWPPVVRALVLTLAVVPTAVYLVMPQLLKAHGGVQRRRAERRG